MSRGGEKLANALEDHGEQIAAEEERLVAFFESEGLTVTTPDVDAFRTHVQAYYLNSDRAALWPDPAEMASSVEQILTGACLHW